MKDLAGYLKNSDVILRTVKRYWSFKWRVDIFCIYGL